MFINKFIVVVSTNKNLEDILYYSDKYIWTKHIEEAKFFNYSFEAEKIVFDDNIRIEVIKKFSDSSNILKIRIAKINLYFNSTEYPIFKQYYK